MRIGDYELKLTSIAVEEIEDKYDKSIDDILQLKLRAKDVNFILWSCIDNKPDYETARKEFAKYNYIELVNTMGELMNPNVEGADTKAS